MEKLRITLAKYSRWQPLDMYVDRMEAHLETDFSIAVENAKALLESICKEICDTKSVELGKKPSINAVLKQAFVALGYTADELVTQVSGSLANIGQYIGNLRNEISPTSHGKSLEELKDRNDKVDLLTRDFLIDSTLVVAVFLIRAFEERQTHAAVPVVGTVEAPPEYDDHEDFNNFWDESFGEFTMGQYSYPASEILFNVDMQAYQAEYKAFIESDEEPAGEDA
ncbi:abortive infection family protein [Polaromonas hydrogenivorans]|uniref:Abortive infection family protein n=1 Tax=Polaromonas hydrogenivorans TaxID=335476 RepID=A0AAU7LR41_9BURK